jgi:hypothetical protein
MQAPFVRLKQMYFARDRLIHFRAHRYSAVTQFPASQARIVYTVAGL